MIPETKYAKSGDVHISYQVLGEGLHVGSRSIFAAAGFAEVSRPTLRRVVMHIDF